MHFVSSQLPIVLSSGSAPMHTLHHIAHPACCKVEDDMAASKLKQECFSRTATLKSTNSTGTCSPGPNLSCYDCNHQCNNNNTLSTTIMNSPLSFSVNSEFSCSPFQLEDGVFHQPWQSSRSFSTSVSTGPFYDFIGSARPQAQPHDVQHSPLSVLDFLQLSAHSKSGPRTVLAATPDSLAERCCDPFSVVPSTTACSSAQMHALRAEFSMELQRAQLQKTLALFSRSSTPAYNRVPHSASPLPAHAPTCSPEFYATLALNTALAGTEAFPDASTATYACKPDVKLPTTFLPALQLQKPRAPILSVPAIASQTSCTSAMQMLFSEFGRHHFATTPTEPHAYANPSSRSRDHDQQQRQQQQQENGNVYLNGSAMLSQAVAPVSPQQNTDISCHIEAAPCSLAHAWYDERAVSQAVDGEVAPSKRARGPPTSFFDSSASSSLSLSSSLQQLKGDLESVHPTMNELAQKSGAQHDGKSIASAASGDTWSADMYKKRKSTCQAHSSTTAAVSPPSALDVDTGRAAECPLLESAFDFENHANCSVSTPPETKMMMMTMEEWSSAVNRLSSEGTIESSSQLSTPALCPVPQHLESDTGAAMGGFDAYANGAHIHSSTSLSTFEFDADSDQYFRDVSEYFDGSVDIDGGGRSRSSSDANSSMQGTPTFPFDFQLEQTRDCLEDYALCASATATVTSSDAGASSHDQAASYAAAANCKTAFSIAIASSADVTSPTTTAIATATATAAHEPSIATHKLEHQRKRVHHCQYCNNTFSSRTCKVRHERTHTGEKPFPCTVCPLRFRQNGTLSTHMRIHNGHQPYECAHCHAPFRHRSSVNRHITSCAKLYRDLEAAAQSAAIQNHSSGSSPPLAIQSSPDPASPSL